MLHVITGPMFSGKTEELIRLLRRHSIAGRTFSVFRPAIDTRSTMVQSRSGSSIDAVSVANPEEILIRSYTGYGPKVDVIALDEAQFFRDSIVSAVAAMIVDTHVIVSGLDKDFAGRPFGSMPQLLAMADQVTKLTAICTVCGDEATMTQRLLDSRDIVVVGGLNDDTYTARCRKHHETR